MLNLPQLPVSIRPLTDAESERLNAQMPDPYDSRGKCVTCKGTKTFRWYGYAAVEAAQVDSVYDFACPCQDQYLLYRFLLNSGIGLTYQRYSWLDIPGSPLSLPKPVGEYLANIGGFVDVGMGLVLWGDTGNGKTLISTLIAKAAIGAGINCHVNTFSEMIERFTAGWYDVESKAHYHRKVKNATLLVIDDIGKEHRAGKTNNGPAMMLLDEVLRHRLAQALPTIITTNLSIEDMGVRYGDAGSVASLLEERSIHHQFIGANFRSSLSDRVKVELGLHLKRPIVL